jgi:hypothetical protein
MKARILLLQSLVICLLSACAGTAPIRSTIITAPTMVPTTAPTMAPTTAPTSTATATVTTGPTSTGQPTESPVELVWSMTGDANPFNTPDGLALDQQGNLYMMDSGNRRIQKFDSDGHFITTWGSRGSDDGQFDCLGLPCMVAVDGQVNVYVTDSGNHRIQKFDSNGEFLAKWGSFGDGDGQFSRPFGVAVDR